MVESFRVSMMVEVVDPKRVRDCPKAFARLLIGIRWWRRPACDIRLAPFFGSSRESFRPVEGEPTPFGNTKDATGSARRVNPVVVRRLSGGGELGPKRWSKIRDRRCELGETYGVSFPINAV